MQQLTSSSAQAFNHRSRNVDMSSSIGVDIDKRCRVSPSCKKHANDASMASRHCDLKRRLPLAVYCVDNGAIVKKESNRLGLTPLNSEMKWPIELLHRCSVKGTQTESAHGGTRENNKITQQAQQHQTTDNVTESRILC